MTRRAIVYLKATFTQRRATPSTPSKQAMVSIAEGDSQYGSCPTSRFAPPFNYFFSPRTNQLTYRRFPAERANSSSVGTDTRFMYTIYPIPYSCGVASDPALSFWSLSEGIVECRKVIHRVHFYSWLLHRNNKKGNTGENLSNSFGCAAMVIQREIVAFSPQQQRDWKLELEGKS